MVSERKRILDILVKCLGDSNTVVQLEANRIVQTLVGGACTVVIGVFYSYTLCTVTPEEFVEVSILDAYRQLLNNPKIPSTQHNYIFNALQKSYKGTFIPSSRFWNIFMLRVVYRSPRCGY